MSDTDNTLSFHSPQSPCLNTLLVLHFHCQKKKIIFQAILECEITLTAKQNIFRENICDVQNEKPFVVVVAQMKNVSFQNTTSNNNIGLVNGKII